MKSNHFPIVQKLCLFCTSTAVCIHMPVQTNPCDIPMFQLLFCNIPLSLYLGHCLDLAVSQHRRHPPRRPLLDWLLHHFVFLWLLSWLMYCAIFVTYLPYGLLAGLICPVYTWGIPFIFYLRWMALSKGQRVIPDEELT